MHILSFDVHTYVNLLFESIRLFRSSPILGIMTDSDPRWIFLQDIVQKTLNIKADKWTKFVTNEGRFHFHAFNVTIIININTYIIINNIILIFIQIKNNYVLKPSENKKLLSKNSWIKRRQFS